MRRDRRCRMAGTSISSRSYQATISDRQSMDAFRHVEFLILTRKIWMREPHRTCAIPNVIASLNNFLTERKRPSQSAPQSIEPFHS